LSSTAEQLATCISIHRDLALEHVRSCRELRVVARLGVRMIGMASAWVLRPFGGAADHGLVEALWPAALAPR